MPQVAPLLYHTRENPFAEPDLPSRRFSPAILHVGITEVGPICYNMVHGSPVAKLPCFAPPQSFLKRFALRWWQLKCRFAASSAPKLHIFHPPTRPVPLLASTVIQGLILCCQARIAPCSTHGASDTCRPRLFCWVLTSDLESGGARCARRP